MQKKYLEVPTFDITIALEHFWRGHVYSVLLLATIFSNPLYKNSSGGDYIIALGNLLLSFCIAIILNNERNSISFNTV